MKRGGERSSSVVLSRPARRGLPARALAMLIVLALTACSAPQLAYERLDWLAGWRLGQFVDLDSSQDAAFETEFQALWKWHRAEELPLYAEDLRQLAATTSGPITAEFIEASAARAGAHVGRVLERARQPACAVISGFSDAQRDSLLRRIDEEIADDADEYLVPTETELRQRAAKRLRQSVERWTGAVSEAQAAQIAAWSQLRPMRYAAWIAQRKEWRGRFAATLDRRREPGLCGELKDLFTPATAKPEALRLQDQADARAWFAFLAGFSETLDARQREHLRDELLDLAADLDQLKPA